VEVNDLKARLPIDRLIEDSYGVELTKSGSEFTACCPFHEEKTPSFSVVPLKDMFYCFGCGASGDHLDFIGKSEGWNASNKDDFKKIKQKMIDLVGGVITELKPIQKQPGRPVKKPKWIPVTPVPETAPALISKGGDGYKTGQIYNPKREGTDKEWTSFRPEEIYRYPGHGYVLRVKINGKKITPQITYCRHSESGEERWCMQSFAEPRPIYGLEQLESKPDATIVMPEGEKAADAGKRLFEKAISVSWPGGGKGITKVDWSPLAGRKVLLLRDNDDPGLAAMDGHFKECGEFKPGVAQMLQSIGATVKIIDPPEGKNKGWDIADEPEWAYENAAEYVKTGMRNPQTDPNQADSEGPSDTSATPPDQEMEPPPDYSDAPTDTYNESPQQFIEPEPFKMLGSSKDYINDKIHFHYYSNNARSVITLTAVQHTHFNLLQIASRQYWERKFGGDERKLSKISWELIANWLIVASQKLPIYDPAKKRGRGAWWDRDHAVVHCGDHIIVNNNHIPLEQIQSNYIYEASIPIRLNLEKPLQNKESHELVKLCEAVSWEKPVYGKLLAGWIASSLVCGALPWRPHAWITGPAGSGKSTVMDKIVKQSVGSMALFVQGESSEAGIRQTLGHDALPVIFDEAESESTKSAQRIDSIMNLVTQASTENQAVMAKGGAGGQAVTYRVRSSFIFSSVGINLRTNPIRGRVAVLSLLKNEVSAASDKAYNQLLQDIDSTLTKEYSHRLLARMVQLIPVMRHNKEVFANAAASHLGGKRMGDQYGSLLAGAYAMHSTDKVTYEAAASWIKEQDWDDVTDPDAMSDELACLQHIMETIVKVQGDRGGTIDRSIGELTMDVLGLTDLENTTVDQDIASQTLKRYGILVDKAEKMLYVSNNHGGIKKILRETQWARDWSRILKRLDGAKPSEPKRFAGGQQTRAVAVPADVALGESMNTDLTDF